MAKYNSLNQTSAAMMLGMTARPPIPSFPERLPMFMVRQSLGRLGCHCFIYSRSLINCLALSCPVPSPGTTMTSPSVIFALKRSMDALIGGDRV